MAGCGGASICRPDGYVLRENRFENGYLFLRLAGSTL